MYVGVGTMRSTEFTISAKKARDIKIKQLFNAKALEKKSHEDHLHREPVNGFCMPHHIQGN